MKVLVRYIETVEREQVLDFDNSLTLDDVEDELRYLTSRTRLDPRYATNLAIESQHLLGVSVIDDE